MPEHSISDLLKGLPGDVAPDPDFAARMRRDLHSELAAQTTTNRQLHAGTAIPPEAIDMDISPTPKPQPAGRQWLLLASAAATIGLVAAAVVLTNHDPASIEPAADPTSPATSQTISEGEQRALNLATTYFQAFGRGDVETVLSLSDLVVTDAESETAFVQWWSESAPADEPREWPSGQCRLLPASDTAPFQVECPLTVADPVAVELDADELTWTITVADNGTIHRQSGPKIGASRDYGIVSQAYSDYMSAYRPNELGPCDPANSENFGLDGLVFTGDCGELISDNAQAIATWIADGRPRPTADLASMVAVADQLTIAMTNGDQTTAIELVDENATISSGFGAAGRDEFELLFGWFAAVDWRFELQDCVARGPGQIECTILQSNAWSDAVDGEPVGGTLTLSFDNGQITAMAYWFDTAWHSLAFGPFLSFVRNNHPDDVDNMWKWKGTNANITGPVLTQSSFALFERYSTEYRTFVSELTRSTTPATTTAGG